MSNLIPIDKPRLTLSIDRVLRFLDEEGIVSTKDLTFKSGTTRFQDLNSDIVLIG